MKKFALVLAAAALAGCNAPKGLVAASAPAPVHPPAGVQQPAQPTADDTASRDAHQAIDEVVAKLPAGHRSLMAFSDPLRAAWTLLANLETAQGTWPKLTLLGGAALAADQTASTLAFTQALAVGQPFSGCRPLPEVGYVTCQLIGVDAGGNPQYRAHGQNAAGWAFDDTVAIDAAHAVFYLHREFATGASAAAETAVFNPPTGYVKYVVQLNGKAVIAINP